MDGFFVLPLVIRRFRSVQAFTGLSYFAIKGLKAASFHNNNNAFTDGRRGAVSFRLSVFSISISTSFVCTGGTREKEGYWCLRSGVVIAAKRWCRWSIRPVGMRWNSDGHVKWCYGAMVLWLDRGKTDKRIKTNPINHVTLFDCVCPVRNQVIMVNWLHCTSTRLLDYSQRWW